MNNFWTRLLRTSPCYPSLLGSSHSSSENGILRVSLASRTFWQSVWFLAVFYAVWPIQFAAFIIPTFPSNYWIYLLAAMFGPLQGFLNALVVFCRDRKSIQRRLSQRTTRMMSQVSTQSQRTKALMARVSTKFANTGSSVLNPSVRNIGRRQNV